MTIARREKALLENLVSQPIQNVRLPNALKKVQKEREKPFNYIKMPLFKLS